jgi:hypothetical protein
MKTCLFVAVFISTLIIPALGQEKDWTLGEFRAKYLGQRVLIMHASDIAGTLGGWQPVLQNGEGSFRSDYHGGAFISLKYKDQTPKIIAIQNSEAKRSAQANIMGDAVSDDTAVGASVIIIAQFDDGQLAEFRSIVSLITDQRVTNPSSCRPLCNSDPDRWSMELLPTSERDAHAAIIAQNLHSTIGKKVYAIHQSLVFGLDITPEDVLNLGGYGKRLEDVPLLTPMTIVGANYNPRYDFIAWKLRLPDGPEIISASRYRDDASSNVGNDNSFLGRSIGSLLMAVPPNLTPREIEAIKGKKIFRGMSKRAVFYSWGIPSENDYGRGGKQLVYGEKQFVYLDLDGKVTDWQSTR